MASNYISLPGEVHSVNNLVGDITLAAGTNISITPSGNTLTIAATGSGGVDTINGDATSAQTITVGTSGTDFAIVNNGTGGHVLNLPTSSASNRGALAAADFSTFNTFGATWLPSRVLFFSAAIHTNLQGVINAAQALAGSAVSDSIGVLIIMPPGDFSAQSGIITKNVSIQGCNALSTVLGTITYRPSSNAAGPRFSILKNLTCNTLNVLAETAAASGIFYNNMFQSGISAAWGNAGLVIDNCNVPTMTANRINYMAFIGCDFGGASNLGMTYCENLLVNDSHLGSIDWHVNDAAANLPSSYSGGNPQFYNSTIETMTLTKDGGATTAYYFAEQTFFTSVVRTGNTDIRQNGGGVLAFTDSNTANNFLDFQSNAPYTPATPGNWSTVPKFVQDGLDSLAASILVITSAAGAGGAATEVMTVTGLLTTDTILSVTQKTKGGNNLPLLGWSTQASNAITAIWSANPGAGAVIMVLVKR